MDTPSASVEELTQRNVESIARMEQEADETRTFAERMADHIAGGIGSWRFILIQTGLFGVYIALNVAAYMRHWDPYPFILLNLFLSFQAAYTGPILMMSQNRQARVAERRNHLDLQINLLAERETTEILSLLQKLCEKQGIPLDATLCRGLEQETQPDKVVRQIKETVEQRKAPKRP